MNCPLNNLHNLLKRKSKRNFSRVSAVRVVLFALSALLNTQASWAITDTVVLPKGVRALIYRSVWAGLEGSYDANGLRTGPAGWPVSAIPVFTAAA